MPLNEFDIIEKIFKSRDIKHPGTVVGIGDDAAIIKTPEGQLLAVSTDTLVKGVHFPENASPYDIGYKSLAVNLSDMAAMAAEPCWATMSLTLPESDESWLQEFSKGFFDIAEQYKVSLIGGDITRGALTITIQIIGCVPPGMQLTRDNAGIGEDIYITGMLGMPAFALSLMRGTVKGDIEHYEQALARLNRPDPRVELAISLRGLSTSAIDVSDGLAADLEHLITSSEVGAEIYLEQVPVYDELSRLDSKQRWELALNMGDDYELCFTAPEIYQQNIHDIGQNFDCGVSRIGKITGTKGIKWQAGDGSQIRLKTRGFRHF
jgi:thiamine-monophosphate kinase